MRPSQREKRIIVWLCVNSVCKSTVCKSCSYPGRHAQEGVSLHVRTWQSNCTWVFSSALWLALSSWLQVTKAQVLQRLLGRLLPSVAARIIQLFAKPNYLALLLSRMSLRRLRWVALLEDSNLVDPASSHMLVSKTKPCMSKYKCYTVKLRMAH